ncbi:hypothetical protein LJC27_04610 [Christensenellaceae bacterium OttesenSCG-928-M15]|nr:hypothetical protein [Christensenellaceae bacterium OttesenSCG-928-M15]
MPNKFNIDALLNETAKHDNAAIPFAQWKQELLKAAREQDADAAEKTENTPSPLVELAEHRQAKDELLAHRRKMRRNITMGFASAAAVLVVVLAANSNLMRTNTANDAAPPSAQQYMTGANEADIAADEDMNGLMRDFVSAEVEEFDLDMMIPEGAFIAPEPAASDAPMASYAAPIDEKSQEAVTAVEKALEAQSAPGESGGDSSVPGGSGETPPELPANDTGTLNGGTQNDEPYAPLFTPYAVFISGQPFRILSLEGVEATTAPEEGYIVFMEDGEKQYLVDAATMEVLGEILEYLPE